MKKKVLSSLMVMGLSAAMIGGATFAWFTDSATNTANTFTAGTLKIAVNDNEDQNYAYSFALGGNLQPGDIVTRTAAGAAGKSVIKIENTGNLDLAVFNRLALTDTDLVDEVNLADALIITDYTMKFYDKDGDEFRTADAFVTNGVPAVGIDPNNDGKLTLNEFANNAWDTGYANGVDFDSLKPGSEIELTYEIEFDKNAGNSYQGKSVTGQFITEATQVKKEAIQQVGVIKDVPGTTLDSWMTYFNNNLGLQK